MNHHPLVFTRAVRALAAAAFMAVAFSALGVHAQTADTPAIAVEDIREAIKTQLPAPPAGFVWQLYKNAVFLQAVNWNEVQRLSSTGGVPSTVYAASPERFSEQRPFEMGLTVQIISGSQKVRRIEAKDMALLYLQPFVDAHTKENLLMLERSENADSERTVLRYRDALAGSNPVIVHTFIVASNAADTVHVFTFQSPEVTWNENWKAYGKAFLGKVVVLPNVAAN